MTDSQQSIKCSIVVDFVNYISQKMNTENVFLPVFPAQEQVAEIPADSIVLIDQGLQYLQDHPEHLANFRNLVAGMQKVICLEDAASSCDVEQIAAIAASRDLPLEFIGYSRDQQHTPRVVSIFSRTYRGKNTIPPQDFHVVALIATYNERDVIESVVNHFYENEVDVYIIDNWSTDGTFEKVERLKGKGVIGLERFPADGPSPYFELVDILKRKEQLSQTIPADWFLHCDADEIRESPWQELNLREAFYQVDQEGFNVVDFIVLRFDPTDDLFKEGMSLAQHFRFFKFDSQGRLKKISAWKKEGRIVDLHTEAGHDIELENKRIYPIKFLLRHYPIRSQAHGERKVFVERKQRWSPDLKKKGWHVQYDSLSKGANFLKDPKDLVQFDNMFYQNYLLERLTAVGLQEIPVDRLTTSSKKQKEDHQRLLQGFLVRVKHRAIKFSDACVCYLKRK